ncbi:DHH family phosphoesterase [Patescibacteria group bacterium]|nr:DHH family phosphoesterase [Patescibacteria group bacterium]MBU4161987.1 DHH family phosphoesterase [Patescibacteria group bacterium]
MPKRKYPKGTKQVAQRILRAAQKGEKVIIFGDADLDGIASVVVLQELFELLNPLYSQNKNIKVYFPDREEEGHGISKEMLNSFKKEVPALFFAVDCGIANIKEIKLAKKIGFETIIIDHHPPLEKVAEPDLLVDPKQKGETYPFTDFAAVGLVYKVAECVLEETSHPEYAKEKLLELTALATLSDQMPLKEDNRELVDKGMNALLTTQRPGLLALIELGDVDLQTDIDIFQKIIAPLNSAKLKNNIAESYLLLIEDSPKKAKILAQRLIRQNKEKKALIQQTLAELIQKIEREKKESLIIFEISDYWPAPALGVIASKLLHIYKKPVFVFKRGEQESVCSARLPYDLDGVDALIKCKKLLKTYGGHAPACGCRVENKNLSKFEKCLEAYFKKQIKQENNG